jgi:hypothetical protein
VPRLLFDQSAQHQAQITRPEYPAGAPSATAPEAATAERQGALGDRLARTAIPAATAARPAPPAVHVVAALVLMDTGKHSVKHIKVSI